MAVKPDIDIKRILISALEATLEDQHSESPHRGRGSQQGQRDDGGHRGLKALAVAAAPFAAGAAAVTAGRAAKKHLPAPARFALSKLVKLPDVGDVADTARDRFADGADALRDRFTDQDDAEAPNEADGHEEDSDDEDLADEILADAHQASDDRPQDEPPQDEGSDETEDDRDEGSDETDDDRDEGSDEIDNDRDEGSDESNNDEREPREPPDLVLEMNRGSGQDTPDLFEALSARHPRPPVMQALNRRTKQAANSD